MKKFKVSSRRLEAKWRSSFAGINSQSNLFQSSCIVNLKMIDFRGREKTWGQSYDDPAPVRSTQRCNTGRDDLDMNGNSNRSLANELSTASPTEVVPQPRVIPSLPVKGTRYIDFLSNFSVCHSKEVYLHVLAV